MVGGVKATFIALLAFSLCLSAVGADKKPLISDPIVEKAIRKELVIKSTVELTKTHLKKVRELAIRDNKLTDVKGLEKLNQLTYLNLYNNPALTEAQIAELQKALPKCIIIMQPHEVTARAD
jgi:hypothetical protein